MSELSSEAIVEWSLRVLDMGDDERTRFEKERKRNGPMKFFGQEAAKAQLAPFMSRVEGFPHTLLLGRPGVGKTRMARWIAQQRSEAFEEFLCPVSPDQLPPDGIVMLDEAHRQKHPEWLFGSMDVGEVSIIAATTRPEQLEPAFKSRFVLQVHLKRYDHESMVEMALALLDMDDASADLYASASAGNPRQLELILAIARELGPEHHEQVLSAARITGDGLTEYHIDLLRALQRAGRPIGLSTLAGTLYSDELSVREYEKLLVELDLVTLKSNGRSLSRKGARFLTDITNRTL